MTAFAPTDVQQSNPPAPLDVASGCGTSIADEAAVFLAREATVRVVRRRLLETQLSRLLDRVAAGGPSAADAAARVTRLVARLDVDDLNW